MVTTVVDGVEMKDTLNAHWKQNKGSFGFRMLQKMGWSEEKGLGKNEDGMVASVKVKRREDGLGLGMEAVKDDVVGSKSWNHTVSGFNAVLELLKTNYNANNQGSENDSESSKKKSKKSKKEKKEKKEKKPRPIISVGIKYKKFRDAKTMEGRSDHDRRAIFGHAITLSPTPVSSNSTTTTMEEKDEDVKQSKKDKKEKKEKKDKKRKREEDDE